MRVGRTACLVAAVLAALLPFAPPPAATAAARLPVLTVSLEEKLAASDADAEVHVIVRFARPVDDALVATLPGDVGYRYRHLPAVALRLAAAAVRALAARPDVARIDEDALVELDPPEAALAETDASGARPADVSYEGHTPIDQGAAEADAGLAEAQSTFGLDGTGMVVAIVDTGIDTRHVDLAGDDKVVAFHDFVTSPDPSCPLAPVPARPFDQNGHGTHVSSIVAGSGAGNPRYRGVAPAAKLVALKIFDCNNSTATSILDESLEWLIDHHAEYGIKVANLSVGAFLQDADGTDTTSILVNRATAAGVTFAVAAGNSGPSKGTVTIPGVAGWALTAGAIGGGSSGRWLTMFSGRGSETGRVKPDVLAPGGEITAAFRSWSTDPDDTTPHSRYANLSGTSMASPFLAGLSALALQADPGLAPSGTACVPEPVSCPEGVVGSSMSVPVRDLMRASADDWGRAGPDPSHGWGAVRAFPVLAAAEGSSSTGPSYPVHRSRVGALSQVGERQVWALRVNDTSRPVHVNLEHASGGAWDQTGWADLDVFTPAGAVIRVEPQCASLCAEPVPKPWGFMGGSFRPAVTGTYYVMVRSEGGAGDYVLDVENAAAVGTDPRPPVVVAPSRRLVEGGASATVTIALGHAPSGPVTVEVGEDSGLNLSPRTLTFTPSTWSVPQSVSVAAPSNGVVDGPHAAALRFVTPGAPVVDATFAEVSLAVADDGAGSAASSATHRLNLTTGGAQADDTPVTEHNGHLRDVSADGRYVLFQALAAAPPGGGPRNTLQGYLRDRQNARTEVVTLGPDGTPIPGWVYLLGMSDDANRILFLVSTENEWALSGDDNGDHDLYIRDRAAGTTTRVNLTSTGAQMPGGACGSSSCPIAGKISGDGSTVVFRTWAGMTPGDTDDQLDLYARDLIAGTTERVSVNDAGAGGTSAEPIDPWMMEFAVDRSGKKVFFNSPADGLAPGHVRAGSPAVYLRDRSAGTTRLVNLDESGAEAPLYRFPTTPVVSPDGRYVAFTEESDSSGLARIVLRDLDASTTTRIGARPDETYGSYEFSAKALDDGGGWIDVSTYDPLGFGGTGNRISSFRRDLVTNHDTQLMPDRTGDAIDGFYVAGSVTNARFVAFRTAWSSVVAGDTNHGMDVYLQVAPGAIDTAFPPSPPIVVVASSVSADGKTSVGWERPVANGAGPLTGYRVTATPVGGGSAVVADVAASGSALSSSATVGGLDPAKSYVVTVVARNGVGPSDPSAPVTAAPAASVPSAPTGVSASGGDRQVSVSWSAPSSDGGSPITGYSVSAAPAGGGGATVVEVGASTTSAVVSGLVNGTSYSVTVKAKNAVGSSSPSSAVTATPANPATVPSAPRNVSATGGVKSVSVSWTAPSSDGGTPVTGYKVSATPSAGGDTTTVTVGASARSATVAGLIDGTAYRVVAVAENAKGSSAATSPVTATTLDRPSQPAVTYMQPGDGSFTVTWTPPSTDGGSPITRYVLHAQLKEGPPDHTAVVGPGTTSATVSGLDNGSSHWVWVTAENAAGSTSSIMATGAPGTRPDPPVDLTATSVGDGQVTISWRLAPTWKGRDVTAARLVLTPIGGGSPRVVSFDGPGGYHVASGLTNGVTYRIAAYASNELGESGPSATIDATPGRRPDAPVLRATPGDGAATLSWDPPANGGRPIAYYVISSRLGEERTVPGDATSAVWDGLSNGSQYEFRLYAVNAFGFSEPSPFVVAKLSRSGYWMVDAAGSVYAFGGATHWGGWSGARVQKAVDLEPTPSGQGYWVLADNGEVYSFGDAAYSGAANGQLQPGEEAASLSRVPSGNGYWVFTDRGRVLPFGDASFFGDMSGVRLNGPVLGSIPTPSGQGYYMVASDGGIFTFGDAAFRGSMGDRRLNAPVKALVPSPSGLGYWLVAGDGGIFTFGDAPFRGSMGDTRLNAPVVGMVAYGNGYLMVAADGGIFTFSDRPFSGSLGGNPPRAAVTAVAPFGG